ncbi:MAG TPA: hypothetical protein VK986_05980 [Tepidisphaeraceae bacterium]|nr:hypothetical protein [Tepidisphaeraceae bacterium]
MARPASGSMNLAQLEKLVQARRSEVDKLNRQRAKVQRKLDAIDARIADLSGGATGGGGGGPRRGPGSRVRNDISLQDLIHQILSKAGAPMGVGDIADKAKASGYRSNSANFRGIVNQTLIKDKRFVSASRGMYKIK